MTFSVRPIASDLSFRPADGFAVSLCGYCSSYIKQEIHIPASRIEAGLKLCVKTGLSEYVLTPWQKLSADLVITVGRVIHKCRQKIRHIIHRCRTRLLLPRVPQVFVLRL